MKVLTPEQEALIQTYQEKWQAIAFSTEPINRKKAEAAVQGAYELMWKKAPRIRFCSSPYEAMLLKLESEENIFNQMFANWGWGEMLSSQVAEIWGGQQNPHSRDRSEREENFFETFFDEIGEIWQGIEWLEKQQNNPLRKMKAELEKSVMEEVKNRVNQRIPKDMQYEEIAEYISEIYGNLASEMNHQNMTNINFPTSQENWREIIAQFERQMWWIPKPFIQWGIEGILAGTLWQKVASVNWVQLEQQLLRELAWEMDAGEFQKRYPCWQPILGAVACTWLDFCLGVWQIPGDLRKWNAMRSVATECGWIFADGDICLVCDRPRILSVDDEHRLHGEAKPAMQFADGYSLYAYHGVIIPEKYGTVHPDRWQAQWLLEEDNAEVRRVLIQGIGYARICQDLQAVELDSFAEYNLLRIDNDVDLEPIYLLKMTCPSTGYIHAMRVPPDVRSAREAIKWVNWGVDPEEFGVQS